MIYFKKYAMLGLVLILLSACKSGVDSASDESGKGQIGDDAVFTFSVANPTTLDLGGSVTFSVYYDGEMLELQGCRVENSDGTEFSNDEGGTVSYTDTTCTYIAPSAAPSSGNELNIVAEIANSSPTLEATLGVVLNAEEPTPEPEPDLCDPANAEVGYWQSWFSCDSPVGEEASYDWWVAFAQENGSTADEANSLLTCLAQTMCASDAEMVQGSCMSLEFVQANAEACMPPEDTSCHGEYVPTGCIGLDESVCDNRYGRVDYGPGYRFYNCVWNEEMDMCSFNGSPEDPEGCTGGELSGVPQSLNDLYGTYVWDGSTRSDEACDLDPAGGMYNPDTSSLEWLSWGGEISALRFVGDSVTYINFVYDTDTGIIDSGVQSGKFFYSGADEVFYFTEGNFSSATCTTRPGKVYTKQ